MGISRRRIAEQTLQQNLASRRIEQIGAAHHLRHTGIGIVNPVSYPLSRSDPLGIVSAVTGVVPPPNPHHPR